MINFESTSPDNGTATQDVVAEESPKVVTEKIIETNYVTNTTVIVVLIVILILIIVAIIGVVLYVRKKTNKKSTHTNKARAQEQTSMLDGENVSRKTLPPPSYDQIANVPLCQPTEGTTV